MSTTNTTTCDNQSITYTDTYGNTATLTPDYGLTITTPTKTLTATVDGFNNGTNELLFTDLYACVEKTKAIKYLQPTNATKLEIVNTIEILDNSITPEYTSNITPNSIIFSSNIDTEYAVYSRTGASLFINGNACYVDPTLIQLNSGVNTSKVIITPSSIEFSDGVTTNSLDKSNWSGNIQTLNNITNSIHYLNFSDSSSTGYGKPQKTSLLSCIPSSGLLTATTFSGAFTGNVTGNVSGNAGSATTSAGVSLTADNGGGPCYIPFSRTTSATGNSLLIDPTTTPLTYTPSSSTLSASTFLSDDGVGNSISVNTSNIVVNSSNNTNTITPSVVQIQELNTGFQGYMGITSTNTIGMDSNSGNSAMGDLNNSVNGSKILVADPNKQIVLSCVDLLSGQWLSNPYIMPINYTTLFDKDINYTDVGTWQQVQQQQFEIPYNQYTETSGFNSWKIEFHINMINMTNPSDSGRAMYIQIWDGSNNIFSPYTFNLETPYTVYNNSSTYTNTSINSQNYGWVDYVNLNGVSAYPLTVKYYLYGDVNLKCSFKWNITMSKTNNVTL